MNQKLRYLAYAVWLILFQCLQFSPQGLLRVSGAYPYLTLLAVVFVAVHEGNFVGSIFGCIAGMLADVNSTNGSGFHAVLYLLAGFICGYLCEALLQRNLLTVMMLCLCSPAMTALIEWLFGGDGAVSLLTAYYLPNAVYTFIISLPLYGIFKVTTGNRRQRMRFAGVYGNEKDAWKPTPVRAKRKVAQKK